MNIKIQQQQIQFPEQQLVNTCFQIEICFIPTPKSPILKGIFVYKIIFIKFTTWMIMITNPIIP